MMQIKLSENNVILNETASSWEEAIRKAAGVLVKNGKASESYVDGIIRSVNEYGPYIVIAPNIAIPHTSSEDGAFETGFALVTFQEPVKFNDEGAEARVLMPFCSSDGESHMEILKMMIQFIEKGFIDEIAKANSLDDLKQIVGTEYFE